MSFPPPPDLPPSEQFIKCNAYKDRIADLAWGKKDDPIIGYRYKGGSNQKVCTRYWKLLINGIIFTL